MNSEILIRWIILGFVICIADSSKMLSVKKSSVLTYIDQMASNVDKSVDPCSDFYKFSCGYMDKKKQAESCHDILKRKTTKQMENLMEDETFGSESHDTQNIYMKKIQILYKSCQNVEKNFEVKKFLDILQPPQGWPLFSNDWNDDDSFSWVNTTAKLRLSGFPIFFQVKIKDDDEELMYMELDITPYEFASLKAFSEMDDNLKNKYNVGITQILKHLGKTEKEAKEIASELISFQEELSDIMHSPDPEEPFDDAVKNLIDFLPDIDLKSYFSILFNNTDTSYYKMAIAAPTYLTKLGTFMLNQDSRIVANFMAVEIVLATFQLHNNCANLIRSKMEYAADLIYTKHLEGSKNIESITELIENMKIKFSELIQNSTWFSDDVKEFAYEKLENIKSRVAKPSFSEAFVNFYYEDVQLDKEDFYSNVINLMKLTVEKNLAVMIVPVWFNTEYNNYVMNAYYSTSKNDITVLATFLQAPFYSTKAPEFFKNGLMSFLVGHELGHSLDYMGIHFAANTTRMDWNTTDDNEIDERAECFIKQSNQYKEHIDAKISLDDTNHIGEILADNTGIRIAWNNFISIGEKRNGFDFGDNEMKLTPGQLFFVSFASFFCEKTEKNPGKLDEHGSNSFRVLNTLKNFDEFSNQFNCPVGSAMNPIDKCRFW